MKNLREDMYDIIEFISATDGLPREALDKPEKSKRIAAVTT